MDNKRKKSPSKTEMKKMPFSYSGKKKPELKPNVKYNYIQEKNKCRKGETPMRGWEGIRYYDFPESLPPAPNPRRRVAQCMWWMEWGRVRCMRGKSTSPHPTETSGKGGGAIPGESFPTFWLYKLYKNYNLYTKRKLYTNTKIRFK